MAGIYPENPILNQQVIVGGKTMQWNGRAWKVVGGGSGGSGSGGGSIVISINDNLPNPASVSEGTEVTIRETFKTYKLVDGVWYGYGQVVVDDFDDLNYANNIVEGTEAYIRSTGQTFIYVIEAGEATGQWTEKDQLGDDVDVTAASYLTLAQAQVSDLEVGQRVVLIDRGDAPMEVLPVGVVPNGFTILGLPNGTSLGIATEGTINVKWAGAVGDGVTDDRPAIEAAYAYKTVAPSIKFTSGTYAVSDGLNLGKVNRSEIIFESGAELLGTGIGTVLTFDGSASTGGVYGCRIINPRVRSTGECQTGFLFRAFQHFYVENPEARDVVNTGMLMQWCIEGTVANYGCSSNRGAFSTTPVSGLIMEERNTGEYCAGLKFTSIAIEGVSGYGIVINDGCRTNNIQGTSEGNLGGGLLINRGQQNNFELFCEVNGDTDIRLKDDAWGNTFLNCIFNSSSSAFTNVELEGAENNTFQSCFIRAINSRVVNRRNVFIGCSVPDGSQGFIGVGDSANLKLGCYRVDISGNPVAQVTDQHGEFGTFLPVVQGATTAGNVTYSSRAAQYSIVGNIAQLTFDIRLQNKGGATGPLQIVGMLFGNNSSLQTWAQLSFWTGININDARTQLSMGFEPNSTVIQLYECGDNVGPGLISMDNIADNAELRFSIQHPISLG